MTGCKRTSCTSGWNKSSDIAAWFFIWWTWRQGSAQHGSSTAGRRTRWSWHWSAVGYGFLVHLGGA
eukprot:3029104-Prorocentrum_lima.AAC.1